MGFWAQRLGLLPLLSLSHLLPGSVWTPKAFYGCINRAEYFDDHGSSPAESKQALNQLCGYWYSTESLLAKQRLTIFSLLLYLHCHLWYLLHGDALAVLTGAAASKATRQRHRSCNQLQLALHFRGK